MGGVSGKLAALKIDVILVMSSCLSQPKRCDKSAADLSVYLKQYPNDAEQYYNRGLSLLNLNRAPEAIADFSKTLELSPGFTRAYRARSNAYNAIGDAAKAEADLAEYEKRQGAGNGAQ